LSFGNQRRKKTSGGENKIKGTLPTEKKERQITKRKKVEDKKRITTKVKRWKTGAIQRKCGSESGVKR